jgi:hypothetical protein
LAHQESPNETTFATEVRGAIQPPAVDVTDAHRKSTLDSGVDAGSLIARQLSHAPAKDDEEGASRAPVVSVTRSEATQAAPPVLPPASSPEPVSPGDRPFPFEAVDPVVVRPLMEPCSEPSSWSGREPQQRPTINVTIGRIEVRATVPQKAAKRARRQSAVMSLDEYLERRARGGQS